MHRIVYQQCPGVALHVVHAQKHKLGIDRPIRNALEVIEKRRARPSSLRSSRLYPSCKDPRPTLRLAGNIVFDASSIAWNTFVFTSARYALAVASLVGDPSSLRK